MSIKSNIFIKSNQIKSNQIKSNQIKSNLSANNKQYTIKKTRNITKTRMSLHKKQKSSAK